MSEEREPLSTARAYFASSKDRWVRRRDEDVFLAGDAGTIIVLGLPLPGYDEIAVVAPGYEPGFLRGFVVGNSHEIQLQRSAALNVRCRDRNGRPVSGVGLAFSRRPVGRDDLQELDRGGAHLPSGDGRWCLLYAETDASGTARCEGLSPGKWFVGLGQGPFVIIDGLDRPWIDFGAGRSDLELVVARYYVAIGRLDDPRGDVTGGAISTSSDGVVATQFNPWLLGKAERLRRAHETEYCEAILFANDVESHGAWPVAVLTLRLQLADSTVQEEPLPIQDPSEGVTPTVVRPRPLQDPGGLGRVVLHLRDATGQEFEVDYMLGRIESKGPPSLVRRRSGRVSSVRPGRYQLLDVPTARLWLSGWPRDHVIAEGTETVIDALIPEKARFHSISVSPLEGDYPVLGKLIMTSGIARAEHPLVGDEIRAILPDSPIQIIIEARTRGRILGSFVVNPALEDTEGKLRLRVGDG
jgi:hypothetical protein